MYVPWTRKKIKWFELPARCCALPSWEAGPVCETTLPVLTPQGFDALVLPGATSVAREGPVAGCWVVCCCAHPSPALPCGTGWSRGRTLPWPQWAVSAPPCHPESQELALNRGERVCPRASFPQKDREAGEGVVRSERGPSGQVPGPQPGLGPGLCPMPLDRAPWNAVRPCSGAQGKSLL